VNFVQPFRHAFKPLYGKYFYRIIFSILSLPLFIYAVIKYFIQGKQHVSTVQQSELDSIVAALKKKYSYLKHNKSESKLKKEAQRIYNHRYRYNDKQPTNDFVSYYTTILTDRFPVIKVICAFPLFILLCFYLNPIVRYIFERFVMALFVIVGVIFVVFTILYLSPLDAAYSILGPEATKDQVHQFNASHNLDQSYLAQLWNAIKGVFTFDLGTSYKGNENVIHAIFIRIPVTLLIALISLIIAIVIAIPIGIISAIKRNTWLDVILMIIALIGLSIPNFWQGLIFILAFSLKLDILPPSYMPNNPLTLILPVIVVGTAVAASITRMTRSSVLEVMRNDYVMTAYAKGLSSQQVITRHILKNAIIPIITLIGLLVADLLGGAAVTEQVFNINGIGRYIVQKQFIPDIPAIMGGVVYISIVISLANLAIDIFYAIVDPKIRSEIKERE
jgi:peptide/nickel transport system permease protein